MSSIENRDFARNEMMVHVPLCTHKEAQNVLVVGEVDDEFKQELAKHTAKVEYGDTTLITSKDDKTIDVILLVNTPLDEMLLSHIEKILNDDGLIAFTTQSFHQDEEKLKADLQLVAQNFWIAMPFKFGHDTAILASKKYHPTADIILQVSDLLEEVNYYSTEMHHASFVFPSYIHRKLTGIAKR
jgi:spermidine synthase